MYINTYIQVVVSMVYLCVLHLLRLCFFKCCNLDQNFGYVKSSTSFRVISRWVNSDHGDTVPSVGNSEVHQSIVQKDCILPIDNFFFISSIIILISEIPQLNKKNIGQNTCNKYIIGPVKSPLYSIRPDFNNIFLFPIRLINKANQYILLTCICNKNRYLIRQTL